MLAEKKMTMCRGGRGKGHRKGRNSSKRNCEYAHSEKEIENIIKIA